MKALLLVALGGGGGAVLRHLVAGATQRAAGAGFPWGTLAVNLLGCLALGALGAWLAGGAPLAALRDESAREDARLLLVVGLLGGFTTYSAFAWDALGLFASGQTARALAYILVTNLACLGGAWAGWLVAGGRSVTR